ncbi:MAG: DUF4382 domain-containing protein [Candidatus Korobacteraceae bacterium]
MIKKVSIFAALSLALLLAACGGGGNGVTANLNPAQTSTVQVTLGDAPGDSVVSFSVSIDSIVLTNNTGGTTSVLTEATRVELTQLAGTATPIATVDIPRATYTQIAITVSAPQITYVHPVSGDTVTREPQVTITRTIRLDPALELGGTAVNLNLDLSVAESVSVDSAGNVTFNPKFLVRHGRLNGAPLPLPRVQPIIGRVEAVSGNVFALSVRFDRGTVRVNTTDQTQWIGSSGISALTPGMIVNVLARFDEVGKLFASKVISLPAPSEIGLEGLVKNTTGSPVTQFSLITHNGIGRLLPWLGGRTVNIQVGGSTVYRIDSDDLDLAALPFSAVFNASALGAGQALEVQAPRPVAAITLDTASISLTASHVTLTAQPVAGQVTGFAGGTTFTLALPPESAIARLTQSDTLPVYMQSGKTRLTGAVDGGSVTLSNEKRAIVRGLLFLDGTQYRLAATHIVVSQ